MHHIRECLPDIKSKIIQQLAKYRTELQELGDPVDGDEDSLVGFFFLSNFFLLRFVIVLTDDLRGLGFAEQRAAHRDH